MDTAKIEKEYPQFPDIKTAVKGIMHEIKAIQEADKQ